MTWRMEKMCDNCPFQRTGPGTQIRRALQRWPATLDGLRNHGYFLCHNTTKEDEEGEHIQGSGILCAGAIAFQERQGTTSQLQQVMERLTKWKQKSSK